MLKKILIANRGEIAVRVIRACKEMGIRTVAVYSDVDCSALHAQEADESVHIGPSPPLESYLNMDRILRAAKETQAEAVHPGYGFLAENHNFAARCDQEGFVFIGPSAESMRLVGDKITARKTVSGFDVPLIPGKAIQGMDIAKFKEAALEIGFPVMIKAAAGGGGKGMRIVHDIQSMQSAVEACMREAKSAFGDDTVYIEKCIVNPRHIEFQVLADTQGHAIHLFERECSIQRRHQKIVEESPSTFVDDDLRRRMGDAAVEVVKATQYANAGTVEFLVDDEKNFYFLEVNARIQVEHPITEMVTGLDLVKWQIRIAAGEPLTLQQEDLSQRGHAIECRIYAEDPGNGFLPSLGHIMACRPPEGPGIRVDSGLFSGYEVTLHYDPILAKLITWSEDRESARQRMIRALTDFTILGIQTTIPFLADVMKEPNFISGETRTDFIPRHMPEWKVDASPEDLQMALIAAAAYREGASLHPTEAVPSAYSPWLDVGGWRIGNL